MMSDESKAEALKAIVCFLVCVAVVVTVPWWGPIVDAAVHPAPIVVVECAR